MAASKKHRFVIGIFERAETLQEALRSLQEIGGEDMAAAILASDSAVSEQLEPFLRSSDHSFLSRLFADLVPVKLDRSGASLCGSRGPLLDLLDVKPNDGSPDLRRVLESWMLPRQASTLADHVVQGALLLWIEVLDPVEERSVSTLFLRLSDHQVQVHELSPPF